MNTRDTPKKGHSLGCLVAAVVLVLVGVWTLASAIWWPCCPKAAQTTCMNNLMQIGKAIELYAMEWGDRRPPLYTTSQGAPEGNAWPDLLMPYLRKMEGSAYRRDLTKLFRCPDAPDDRLSYSVNPRAAGREIREIKYPAATIAVFESVNDSPRNNNLNGDSIWRPSDGGVPGIGQLVIWPVKEPLLGPKLPEWAGPRHNGATDILFTDGHCTSVTAKSSTNPPEYTPRFDPAKPTRQ